MSQPSGAQLLLFLTALVVCFRVYFLVFRLWQYPLRNGHGFFLGIEVTLDILNFRQYWQLGISQLDLNTYLAPPVGSPLWYSLYVVSPVVLTDEQRERILCIAEYMKGAHEHLLGITEPGDVVTASSYWILNQSLLGSDPNVNPSTILA